MSKNTQIMLEQANGSEKPLEGHDGKLKSVGYHYNSGALAYQVNTGGDGTGSEVEVTNFPANPATSTLQTNGNASLATIATETASIDDKTPMLPRSTTGTLTFDPASTIEFDLTTNGGGIESVAIHALGTWGGDITVEASINGTGDWYLIEGITPETVGGINVVTSYLTTARRVLHVNVAGYEKIRVTSSSMASGSSTVTMTGSSASVNYYRLPTAADSVTDDKENDFVSIDGIDQLKAQDTNGRATGYVEITGTWVGTIEFRGGVGNFDPSEDRLQAWPVDINGNISGTPVTSTTANGRWLINCAGHPAFFVYSTAWTSGTANVTTTATVAHKILSTDVLRLPSLAAGSNVIGKVGIDQTTNGTTNRVNIGSDGTVTVAASTNRIGSVRLVDSADTDLTSAKGTQASRAVAVQPLSESGRTHVRFWANGVAAGTSGTETAITLTRSSGTETAITTGTSFVITSGKRFKITSIVCASRGHSTGTAQVTTFNFRLNTAGAVTTSSTPIWRSKRVATPATALAYDRNSETSGDVDEILGDGTLQFGVTANAVFTTNAPTWDIEIMGYEY